MRLHSTQCTLKPGSEGTTGSSIFCLSTIIIKLLLANHPNSAIGNHGLSRFTHVAVEAKGLGFASFVLSEEVLRESGGFF